MAQLLSRWSVMIREHVEAATLLICSTAGGLDMSGCLQRGFALLYCFLKQIATNSASEFVFIHIQTGSHLYLFFSWAGRESKPLFSR